MKIALISCSKEKQEGLGFKPAHVLYSKSTLFSYSYEYAKALNCDKIFILSALHGLVEENQPLEKYDYTLIGKPKEVRKEWANKVIKDLKEVSDIDNDTFVILAGSVYMEYLSPSLKYIEDPLGKLPLGKRLSYLKDYCKKSNNIGFVNQLMIK